VIAPNVIKSIAPINSGIVTVKILVETRLSKPTLTILSTQTVKQRALAESVVGSPSAGVSTAKGRVFRLYGPGEHPRQLVTSVVRPLLRDEPAPRTQARFVHVEDVAWR
jgi:hypothetical protein